MAGFWRLSIFALNHAELANSLGREIFVVSLILAHFLVGIELVLPVPDVGFIRVGLCHGGFLTGWGNVQVGFIRE